METIDKVKISIGAISFQENGIIRHEINELDTITIFHLKENLETIKKIGEGKAYCNLIIMKNFTHCDAEARKFAASEENNIYTIADAFVTESEALRIVGNFYIRFDKPTRPTKLFKKEDDALKWLRTFL